jgi:hypothetical protein
MLAKDLSGKDNKTARQSVGSQDSSQSSENSKANRIETQWEVLWNLEKFVRCPFNSILERGSKVLA